MPEPVKPSGQPAFWARFGKKLAWGAALVLSLPALSVGALNDDFLQHLVLDGVIPVAHLGPTSLHDLSRSLPRAYGSPTSSAPSV